MSLVMTDGRMMMEYDLCFEFPRVILVECRIASHVYLPHTRAYLKTIIKQELLLIKQVDSLPVPCSTF